MWCVHGAPAPMTAAAARGVDQTALSEVPLAASPGPRPRRTAEAERTPEPAQGSISKLLGRFGKRPRHKQFPRRARARVAVAPLHTEVPATDCLRARAVGAAEERGQGDVTHTDRIDHSRTRRPPPAVGVDPAATPTTTAPPRPRRRRRKCPVRPIGMALGRARHGSGRGSVPSQRWSVGGGGSPV